MENSLAGTAATVTGKVWSPCRQTDHLSAARQRFEEMVRAGTFKPAVRYVAGAHDREDRVAEGLAHAWRWYRHQALQGHVPETALVRHVIALRTKDRRRRFVSGDLTRWREDVYERQGTDIQLRRIDEVSDDDERERREDRCVGLARPGATNPTTNIVSGIDLDSWLDDLGTDDRKAVTMRGEGYSLGEIGKATGRSAATVCRRVRALGGELATRAEAAVPSGASR